MAKKLCIALFLSLSVSCNAFAQEFVSTHGEWSVFTVNKGGKVCYMASAPVKNAGTFSKRGEAYVLVTSRGPETDEVSVSSGFPYKSGSKVKVEVDGNKFEFFTKDDLAWAYDSEADAKIVNALKKGKRLTVRGSSPRETYAFDTYSLKGTTAAYNKMKEACR